MKKFTVIASSLGTGKLGLGKLFLINSDGETLKVSADFAAANKIDETYRGLVMYRSEHHKKGDAYEYTDKAGVVQKGIYTNDFERITQIVAADASAWNKELETKTLEVKFSIAKMAANL